MAVNFPVRQQSAHGKPAPETSIERTCVNCGASFIGLAFDGTEQRGIWHGWRWWCSVECTPQEIRGTA